MTTGQWATTIITAAAVGFPLGTFLGVFLATAIGGGTAIIYGTMAATIFAAGTIARERILTH